MNSTPRLSRICLLIRDYHFISLSMEPPALLQLRFLFSHQPFTSLVHQIIQPASAESWQSTEGTQQVKCAKVTSLLIPADISISLGECSGNLIWHIHTKWCLKNQGSKSVPGEGELGISDGELNLWQTLNG